MTNPLDHLAADVERVIEEHRPEIESAFSLAETAAVAIDPQLAALAPMFGELTDAGKRLVVDTLQAIHGAGILRNVSEPAPATPDPTSAGAADGGTSATADASSPAAPPSTTPATEPPLVVGPPVA